jgi:hypothetical protein
MQGTMSKTRFRDDALLLSLACGATPEVAAQKAGVCVTTVYRRLRNPEFVKKLREARSEMMQRATAMLTAAAMEAVKTLLDLQAKSAPAATRLGAARSILELGSKLRHELELTARIEALEQQIKPSHPEEISDC